MRTEFRLPDIGEGLAEAEVIRWLVGPGERVAEDQPVVELQTDKAAVELPSPAAGVLVEQLAAEGDTVRVGAVLFALDTGPAAADAGAPSPAALPQASPAVRRLARELGVDLAAVRGSGPHGRVLETDVRAAAEAAA